VLTVRLRGLLFGMVFSAIAISFSVNDSIEQPSVFAMVSSSKHVSEKEWDDSLDHILATLPMPIGGRVCFVVFFCNFYGIYCYQVER